MRNDSVEHTGEAQYEAEPEVQETEIEEFPIREKPDGALDPAGEAGWYLEREREARGLSLEDAGDAVGIHPYHLEAIELGDLTCLPERSDALEMIGAYAQFLSFDPEPLVEHYAQFLPMPLPPMAEEVRHPANPAPLSSAKVLAFGRLKQLKSRLTGVRGGTGGLVASLAAAILLFGAAGYFLLGRESAPPAPQVTGEIAAPALPDSDPMPTASTGPEAGSISVGEAPLPDDEALATKAVQAGEDDLAGTGLDGITSLIEQNVTGADGKPVGDTASAADVAITKEGREFGTGNNESRLTLKAKAPVWVRIEDSHGNVVMTQMLMKGDTYRVPNREGLVVIARDGGLLSYLIDGKEKGILGSPGEILVGRSLDVKSFEG